MPLERLMLAVELLNELIAETDWSTPRQATLVEAKRCVLIEISQDYGHAAWERASALPFPTRTSA